MNTITLCQLACSDFLIRKTFGGVFPCDTLPLNRKQFSTFIVNLDTHDQAGTHWIAIFFDKNNRVFYFDSYGIEPTNKNILNFMKRNAKEIFYNKFCFQDDSTTTCGYFCLYFLHCSVRNSTMEKLNKKKKKENEIFIKKFVHQNFHKRACCHFSYSKQQSCISAINMMSQQLRYH